MEPCRDSYVDVSADRVRRRVNAGLCEATIADGVGQTAGVWISVTTTSIGVN